MQLDRLARAARLAALGTFLSIAGCSHGAVDATDDGTDAVRAALAADPDPTQANQNGNAVIHIAAIRQDPEMLGAYLDRGVAVDLRNASNMTALGISVEFGCLSCVLQLLQAHADPNAPQGRRGDRALNVAASKGSVESVRMLLNAGADPNLQNIAGDTPLASASGADGYHAVDLAKVLLDHGADRNLRNALGETPVHAAARHDAVDLLRFYASIGADLDAPNAWGATPLDRAVEAHCDRATDVLYRLGARTATTRRFEPPLVTAARTDDANRARWLLIFGADPKKPFEGQSALDVARSSGSKSVVAIFEAAVHP